MGVDIFFLAKHVDIQPIIAPGIAMIPRMPNNVPENSGKSSYPETPVNT